MRLVAGAKLFIGVHGQAQENAVFLRPGALMVELFHESFLDEIPLEGVGRQPLFRGSDVLYATAALLQSPCKQIDWKFDPHCPSIVDVARLDRALHRWNAQLQRWHNPG